jgi:hypothetical protein
VYYHVYVHIETKVEATLNTKSERITLLGSRDFKAFLSRESRKEGVSVSELVRRRCERAPTDDERALLALAGELRKATAEARQALEEGLSAAADVLRQVRKVEKKAA